MGPARYSVDLILRCSPFDEILQQEINDYVIDGTSLTFEACLKRPVKLKACKDYRVFVKMKVRLHVITLSFFLFYFSLFFTSSAEYRNN